MRYGLIVMQFADGLWYWVGVSLRQRPKVGVRMRQHIQATWTIAPVLGFTLTHAMDFFERILHSEQRYGYMGEKVRATCHRCGHYWYTRVTKPAEMIDGKAASGVLVMHDQCHRCGSGYQNMSVSSVSSAAELDGSVFVRSAGA